MLFLQTNDKQNKLLLKVKVCYFSDIVIYKIEFLLIF